MSSSLKLRSAILAALLVAAVPSVASADDVDRCVAASEKGQKERRSGNLMEARAAFLQCAGEKCPSVVKSACSEWLDQVNASLPTLIIAVTDSDHKDLVDARILVDGKSVALGRAVQVNPGPHSVAAESDGFQSQTQSIVARETEHNRAISFTLSKKTADPPLSPKAPTEEKGVRPITWITGGLAIAALGSFAGFGLRGRFIAGDLRDTCAPNCATDERDRAHTSYVIADVSLIAAVILGGVSVVTYFMNKD